MCVLIFFMEDLNEFIFSPATDFTAKALKTFHFQYQNNTVYKRYADSLNCRPSLIKTLEQIPFLPISFFKNHSITTTQFQPELIFESSGTSNAGNSHHLVKKSSLYESSFIKGFNKFYGNIEDYCIVGLLPSYLERKGSSLVYMVEKMMQISKHPLNGFHLYDHAALAGKLKKLENTGQKTILIGVTYALLEFAQNFPLFLNHTIIIETGGMKGRKKEMIRHEVHTLLKEAFGLSQIHSEYGMTELLSQAYAMQDGLFETPHWMRVLIREEDDPLSIITAPLKSTTGIINIIDLANVFSCSFIATDDAGRLNNDGTFEVLGRMDNSDIRGCSLMVF